jgi:hypothetical protein
MALVRDEFGPTLPELLGSRLGVRVRTVWLALAVVGAVAVAIVAWLSLRPDPSRTQVIIHKPLAFNLLYPHVVHRVPPRSGEVLRLESVRGAPQSMAVRVRHLPAYRGDASALFAVMSSRLTDEMRTQYLGFIARGDGRISINKQPGYQVVFQARINGRTTYGKRVLLVASSFPSPREALDITVLAARSPSVPNADTVGTNGAMKTPFRSLRFGTDRP